MYVTVIEACLDGKHNECSEVENMPEQVDGRYVACGGGMCICPCHSDKRDFNDPWYKEVKASAIRIREKRARDSEVL